MGIFEKFNDQGLGKRDAFERLCCQLFESWGKSEAGFDAQWTFRNINGAGGDGGIEAYWHNANMDEWVGIQAKWFPERLRTPQFNQLRNSIDAALKLRPTMKRYIVCIPHDLTSKKIVKGGKTGRGEDEDWNDFEQAIHDTYPSLAIVLWDESKIHSLLKEHESEGCWRFWFDKSEINPETIRLSLEQATAAIADRYTPEINADGGMTTFLEGFFGTIASRRTLLHDIDSPIAETEHLIGKIDSFLSIGKQKFVINAELAHTCRDALEGYIQSLQNLREIVRVEPAAPTKLNYPEVNYSSIETFHREIGDLKRAHISSDHLRELDEALDGFHELPGIRELQRSVTHTTNDTHCVIHGSQGTGKTCGLASTARKFLGTREHSPILVLATDFRDEDSWYQAIQHALGLGSGWDETSLWQALSSYAALSDVTNDDLYIRSKVAIMVDALDERPPSSAWEKRIRETDAISARYPRIRFAFTSRPVGIRFKDTSLLNCTYRIRDNGDVPVWRLFDRYIEHFNIDPGGDDRYKWLLNTPSELRMFCAAYHDRILPGQVSTCLTDLTNAEINRLDEEFAARSSQAEPCHTSQAVRRALQGLSSLFMSTGGPAGKEEIRRALAGSDISEPHHEPLITFLSDYGILRKRKKRESNKSPFAPDSHNYSPGSRHLWDYFMAYAMWQNKDATLKTLLENNPDAANMYGVLLVEGGILPRESERLVEAVGEHEAYEITLYALSHATPNKAAKYREWALVELQKRGDALSGIVNDVVLPVANTPAHPLGPTMLDEFLRSFSSPIARDVIWSFPASIREGDVHHGPRLSLYFERESLKAMPKLQGFETASQMPLVLAWGLSAVSNLKRRHCSGELVKWGMRNPKEFTELFRKFYLCDDPQIREDMFAIAEEIVCQGQIDADTQTALKYLVVDSAFKSPDNPGNRDAAVRFYGRLIVEHCYNEKLASKTELSLCRPPYETCNQSAPLPIFPDAATATSMRGYGPIHYDLARYVLVDRLSSTFDVAEHAPHKCAGNAALDKAIAASAEQAGLSDKPDFQGWVIAAAYQYLLNHGYDSELLQGSINANGYRTGGLDRKVIQAFSRADHGTRSTIMTVAEKYVWCARNEIGGYLADRVGVSDNRTGDSSCPAGNDTAGTYGMLFSFDSPLLEATAAEYNEIRSADVPVFPVPFSCSEDKPCSEQQLKSWIDAATPETATCLIDYQPNTITAIEGEAVPLSLYACDWGTCGKTSSAWLSCGAIEASELSKLVDATSACVNGYQGTSDFRVSFESKGGATYISPVEAFSSSCIHEYDEAHPRKQIADSYVNAKPLAGEGVACLIDVGEYWYYFPSDLTKGLCNVNHTDGVRYFAKDNQPILEEVRYGVEYRHRYQALLADKNALKSALDKSDLKLIWLATIQRGPNNLARERIPEIGSWEQRSWLIWIDDGKHRSVALTDTEAPNVASTDLETQNILEKLLKRDKRKTN